MKDLDTILTESPSTPRYELPANFTAAIVVELKTHPRPAQKETWYMKFMKRPMVIALAALMVLGGMTGTAYAGTDGFTKPFDFQNIFGYREQTLRDGSKVIGIKTSDCSGAAYITSTSNEVSDGTLYLKQKAGSTLATRDVLEYVQGYCESLLSQTQLLQDIRANTDTPIYGSNEPVYGGGLVTSRTDSTITVQGMTMGDDGKEKMIEDTSRYDTATVVKAAKGASLSVKDIAVGRWVTTLGVHDGSSDRLIYVYQSSAAETAYDKRQVANTYNPGSDVFSGQITRVIPCATDTSGFCAWNTQADNASAIKLKDAAVGAQDGESATAPGGGAPTPAPRTAQDPTGIAHHITSIITTYSNNPTEDAMVTFKHYVTPELAATIDQAYGVNPITCSQGMYASISFGKPVVVGRTITVAMFGTFEGDTTPRSVSEITYDTTQQKVSKITCLAGRGF